MKKHLILPFLILAFSAAFAQQKQYNVVFDMTSGDTLDHRSVVRWVNDISKAQPDAKLEVVFYGPALAMVNKEKSIVADDLTRLSANKNVSFKVCEVAMARQKLDKSQLVPGVQTVPDGIYEILTRQSEGWGYIKAAR